MSSQSQFGSKLASSFLSGLIATLPMTIWMLGANRALPTVNPDPLPPEEITRNLAKKTNIDHKLSSPAEKKASVFNHFLYGGLVATPYGFFGQSHKSMISGISYGLVVWASNYLGLLPALNLYPSATKESRRMNGMMIVAHVIWGGVLGWLLNGSSSTRNQQDLIPISRSTLRLPIYWF